MSVLEIILAIIALQVAAFIYLLVAIVVTYARRARVDVDQLSHQWARQLPDALEGRAEAIDFIRGSLSTDAVRKAFRTFIDEQLYSDINDSLPALRELSRAVGFTEWLRHQALNSRNQLDRAAAGKTLGRLQESVDREVAVKLLQSSDPAVVLAASHTIASLGDPDYLLPVFRAVYQRTPITIHGAAGLLSEFGRGACPAIHELLRAVVDRYLQADAAESYRSLDPEREIDVNDVVAQVVMIDLLAFYAYLPSASTLLALLSLSKAEETIIHVVKALAEVGDVKAVPQLVEMLTHSNWVIRSQTARTLAALDAVEAIPSIRTLLGDESLRVQLYAQRALRSLEGLETGSLEAVSSLGVFA
ncbi:MAG: HEAT repeat domain-containing protein [Thermoleophilia bacterium]|jgi:HEAT repeat protein